MLRLIVVGPVSLHACVCVCVYVCACVTVHTHIQCMCLPAHGLWSKRKAQERQVAGVQFGAVSCWMLCKEQIKADSSAGVSFHWAATCILQRSSDFSEMSAINLSLSSLTVSLLLLFKLTYTLYCQQTGFWWDRLKCDSARTVICFLSHCFFHLMQRQWQAPANNPTMLQTKSHQRNI